MQELANDLGFNSEDACHVLGDRIQVSEEGFDKG
jgi:hypothetical protein